MIRVFKNGAVEVTYQGLRVQMESESACPLRLIYLAICEARILVNASSAQLVVSHLQNKKGTDNHPKCKCGHLKSFHKPWILNGMCIAQGCECVWYQPAVKESRKEKSDGQEG